MQIYQMPAALHSRRKKTKMTDDSVDLATRHIHIRFFQIRKGNKNIQKSLLTKNERKGKNTLPDLLQMIVPTRYQHLQIEE